MFNIMEVFTEKIVMVRFLKVCRGQRAWHEEREISKNLGDLIRSKIVKTILGRTIQSYKRTTDDVIRSRINHRGRESRLHGEGVDRSMHTSKETISGRVKPEPILTDRKSTRL